MITKTQRLIAIILGICTGFLVVGLISYACMSKMGIHILKYEPTYYDKEVLSRLLTNLEKISGGDIGYTPVIDEASAVVTAYGQHLNNEMDIVLFGKTAEDFEVLPDFREGQSDLLLLNKMIRKLYITSDYDVIHEMNKELLQSEHSSMCGTGYDISGLKINGLENLEDHDTPQITNELRFAIIGFVKVYLGLTNLNEVTVTQIEDAAPYYSFTLTLPTGESYRFDYVLQNGTITEIADLKVSREIEFARE